MRIQLNISQYSHLTVWKFNWVYLNTVTLTYENSTEYIWIQSSYHMKIQLSISQYHMKIPLSISQYSHLNIWEFNWVYLNTVTLPYESSIEYISIQSSYHMKVQLSISQYSHLTIWKFSWVYLNTVILTYENSVEYISIQSS
jgi:uncharacterized protein YxjI